jgi:hypothetical protein
MASCGVADEDSSTLFPPVFLVCVCVCVCVCERERERERERVLCLCVCVYVCVCVCAFVASEKFKHMILTCDCVSCVSD